MRPVFNAILVAAQTGLVKQKFVEAIQNYQTVEQQYRTKYKQRMERQYKIGESRARFSSVLILTCHCS